MAEESKSHSTEGRRRRRSTKAPAGAEVRDWDRKPIGGLVHWIAVLWILTVAGAGILNSPGISRPYPGLTVALGGITTVLAAAFFARFKLSERGNRLQAIAIVWLIWCVISAIGSIDSFRSAQTLASWSGGIGLFLLASFAATSGLHWRAMVWGLSCIATAITVHGLMNIGEDGQLLGTFSNRDSFAVIPLIGFFFALSQTQWYQLPGVRYAAWIQAIVMGLAVGRSSSRAAALGLICGVILTGVFLSLDKDQTRKRKVTKGTLVGLAAMLCIALFSGILLPLMVRVEELRKGEDNQGVAMREDVLVYGLRTSLARPISGSGPGTFALAYQTFRPPSVVPDYIYVNVAHDDPVEVVVEFGWIGLALAGALWLSVLSRATRLTRYGKAPWEASALVGGIGAIAAYSTLNFIIAVPVLLHWELLALASIQAIPVRIPEPVQKLSIGRAFAVIVLVGLGGWTTYFGIQSSRANHHAAESERLANELRWEEALQSLESALKIQPQAKLYALRGTLRGSLAKFTRQKQNLTSITQDHEMAAKLSPRDPYLAKSRLLFYENTQQYDRAEKTLLQMIEHAPYQQWHIKELVRVQLLQGRLKEAARTVYEKFDIDSEGLDLIAPILVNLEIKRHGDAIAMFLEWSSEEGEVSRHLQLALLTAEYALAKSLPAVAERILLFVNERDPESAQTLYLLTRTYGLQGKPLRRREFLARLLRLPPDARNDRYLDLALVEWAKTRPRSQDSKPIILKLQKRLQEAPKSPSIRLFLSGIYLKENRVEAATEMISQGLDYSPDDPRLLARMGTCLLRQGLNDMAADYFSQALKVDPSNLEAKRGGRNVPSPP